MRYEVEYSALSLSRQLLAGGRGNLPPSKARKVWAEWTRIIVSLQKKSSQGA